MEERSVLGVVWEWFDVCRCYYVCFVGIGCWRDEGVYLVGGGRVYL